MYLSKRERIQAALQGEEVDRVPVNLWMHFSAVDQDPRSLAETQTAFVEKYDFDFLKLMPFGLYGVQDYGVKVQIYNQVNHPPVAADYAIHEAKDWERIEPLPAYYGTYGKQVQAAAYAVKLAKGRYPVIQTIFSPLTTARKMAGDRILLDMLETPELFGRALQALTETTIRFVEANLEAGVDGFFFATQCANTDFMTEDNYRKFGSFYDLQVLRAYQDSAWFRVAHIHGDNGMFDLINGYPVNCINWHDRWSGPSLKEARKRTDKCLMGGIRELPYYDEKGGRIREAILNVGSVDQVEQHILEAVAEVDGRGLIVSPGCVADQLVPEKNIYAVRGAVSSGAHLSRAV